MGSFDDFGGGGPFDPGPGPRSPFGDGPERPDIEEALERLKKIAPLVVLAAVLLAIGSLIAAAVFTVEPEEEAIMLRFGEPTGTTYGPGLHTKIPFADMVFKVPVQRQHRIEFGFRSQPGKVTQVQEVGPELEAESLMLTGDLMLAHVRWSVIYRIDDIETWLFNVKDKENTIRDIAMAVMRQLVGDYSLHEVLTSKVREIQSRGMEETQKALRVKVPTGVTITELSIRSTDVPLGAKKAFDEFNRTEPDVARKLAEAKAMQHTVTGDAEQAKKGAIGKAEKLKAEVEQGATGEALAFSSKLREYMKAPEITRQWMYLQTMSEVLQGVDDKLIVEDGSGNDTVKLLPLTDIPGLSSRKPAAPAKGGGR